LRDSGNVSAFTMMVSRIMAKPYEYGTCSVESALSRTCAVAARVTRHVSGALSSPRPLC